MFKIILSIESNHDQDFNRKEIYRAKIASNGIQEVLNACKDRLNLFTNILIDYKPKVIKFMQNFAV